MVEMTSTWSDGSREIDEFWTNDATEGVEKLKGMGGFAGVGDVEAL
jgi:hypothetical protein